MPLRSSPTPCWGRRWERRWRNCSLANRGPNGQLDDEAFYSCLNTVNALIWPYAIERIYAREHAWAEDVQLDSTNHETLENKSLLVKRINIRAFNYRFSDKKKYYRRLPQRGGFLKETKIRKLISTADEPSDCAEDAILCPRQADHRLVHRLCRDERSYGKVIHVAIMRVQNGSANPQG